MDEEEQTSPSIKLGAVVAVIAGVLYLGKVHSERKKIEKTRNEIASVIRVFNRSVGRIREVQLDPETTVDDLATAMFEESCFIDVVINESM